MRTMMRFLIALRLRTDQETVEWFVLRCLRCLLDKEDDVLEWMLKNNGAMVQHSNEC